LDRRSDSLSKTQDVLLEDKGSGEQQSNLTGPSKSFPKSNCFEGKAFLWGTRIFAGAGDLVHTKVKKPAPAPAPGGFGNPRSEAESMETSGATRASKKKERNQRVLTDPDFNMGEVKKTAHK